VGEVGEREVGEVGREVGEYEKEYKIRREK